MAKGESWKDLYAGLDGDEREEKEEDLMYLFIDETDMDVEDVYSLVFMEGRKISWH
jgi:hypothetical protein